MTCRSVVLSWGMTPWMDFLQCFFNVGIHRVYHYILFCKRNTMCRQMVLYHIYIAIPWHNDAMVILRFSFLVMIISNTIIWTQQCNYLENPYIRDIVSIKKICFSGTIFSPSILYSVFLCI